LRRLPIFLVICSLFFNAGFTLPQQTGVTFTGVSQQYTFGTTLDITGKIETGLTLTDAVLVLQPTGMNTQIYPVMAQPGGDVAVHIDLQAKPLQAFSENEYWFQVTTESGSTITSPKVSFFYEDNRFNWQRLTSGAVEIAWSAGDPEFGALIQNTVGDGIETARTILQTDFVQPLRLYVYPTAQDMQSAAQLAAMPWAAGHANPEFGVIFISVSPGPDARAEMERQIPHEIMHILEYQLAGNAYITLPAWLREGLATSAELYPNPEYQRLLQKAVVEDTLLPLSVLCQDFPRDLSGALLAYAQSSSFVRFLTQNFGSSGLTNLIHRYADGMNCEAGVQSAFGASLVSLESRWQQEMLGRNPGLSAWKQLWPYLLLGVLILIPLVLSIISLRRKMPVRRETTGEQRT